MYVRSISVHCVVATSDVRSHRSFSLLALSARRRHIIDTVLFLMGSLPSERRRVRDEFPPVKKKIGDRGVFQMQYQ